MNYKKGIIALTLIIMFNFLLTASLSAGIYYFAEKTYGSKNKLIEEGKEKAFYLITKFSKKFMDDKDELRAENPEIVISQNSYDVYDYDLSINFDMDGKKIDGTCYMTAKSLTDTLGTIYINFYDNMNVSNVAFVNATRLSNTYQDVRDIPNWQEVEYKRLNNYLIIDAKGKFSKDEQFVVKISYSGTPVSRGFDSFSFKDIYNNRIAYTLSEPNYAPVWWPCKDLPDDKALQNMRLTVPTGYKGVSNGLLTDTIQNSDGTTTFNWSSNYPISTYLVSVVVAKFSYWEDTYTSLDGTKSMPVVYYAFPRDSAKAFYDWARTPEMIKLYSKTFSEYPFIDEKYGMAQFGWTSGAMEHQTITSMGYLLVTGDRRYEEIVAHELAHHWFGDAVTLETWDDIWLNEAFATYCEALWVEYDRGKQAYFDYLKNYDYGYFSGTVYAPQGGLSNPAIYATVYQKGGWVLHMLRGVLGDEIFFKSIQTYYERYKYKNANTKQLVSVFEEVSGKDLGWFFDQWIYIGTGRPKYEYSWRFEDFQGQENSGKYTVHLEIKQVQTDYDVYKMPIKIRVVTDAGDKDFTVFNDSKTQSFLLTVDAKPKEVKLDPDGWILKKIAKGTYR